MNIRIKQINNCIWAFCMTLFVASAVNAENGRNYRGKTSLKETFALMNTVSARGVSPDTLAGNIGCQEGDADNFFRIPDPVTDTYFGPNGFVVSIIVNSSTKTFSWFANGDVQKVYVKGGPDTNRYEYPAGNGAPPHHKDQPPSLDDGNLHSPVNEKNDTYYGLSHVDFCYNEIVPNIDITKVCDNNTPDLNEDPIEYTYDVGGCFENIGEVSVDNLHVTDDRPLNGDLKFYIPQSDLSPGQCNNYGALENAANNGTVIVDPSTYVLDPGEQVIWLATFTDTMNGGSNEATGSADGPTTVTSTASAQCPENQFNPNLTVTKNCVTSLVDAGDHLEVKVTISGYVCNIGDVPLNNVMIVDDTTPAIPGLPNPILNAGTLQPLNGGNCDKGSPSAAYYENVMYTPDTLPSDQITYLFEDQVKATGTAPAGVGPTAQCPEVGGLATCMATASAGCSLCKEELICPE